MMPIARKNDVITEKLAEETLVYDLKRHRAHCLNSVASAVWRYCDGETDVEEMTRRLQRGMVVPVDESLVRMALRQLLRAGLIETDSAIAPATLRLSRRKIARDLSVGAALAIPLVTSMVVPTAAMAQSQNRSGGGGGGRGGRGPGRGRHH